VRIRSYDDLTPSIPDVSPGEVLSVGAVLNRTWSKDPVPTNNQDNDRTGSIAPVSPKQKANRDVAPGSSDPGDSPRARYAALHDNGTIERLIAIARDFSPRIERHPGGTVVLDVSGLTRLFGDAASIADHLARAGATRVGIAASQTTALLLARAYEGIQVAAEDAAAALCNVPLGVLQQLVEDREAAAVRPRPVRGFDVLGRWGLTTLGELAALPAGALSARLGSEGIRLQQLARGVDPRPLVPDPGVRRFIESCELEWPIDLLEPLSFVFARLLDPLAAALERADRGAIALHLQLRLTDRTVYPRTLALPVPMRDPRVLRTLLLLDLESHPPAAAIDVVTIEADPAPGRVVQYSLLERPVPSPETLATLMARLGALVGETRCGSPQILDTHRPDGWTLAPVAFDDRVRAIEGTGTTRSASRPSSMGLRRFRPPVAVRVTVERGRPGRVAIDRSGMPGGTVQEVAGPWRSSGGWWQSLRWNRDEWDVAFEGGAVCRLFQDRETEQWFVDGIYD
jgi:protein ImuB